MDYEVRLAPIDKCVVSSKGFFEPLCNNCASPDCTNPIEEKTVYVVGIPKVYRVWMEREGIIRQVVDCKGYTDATQLSSKSRNLKS